MIKVITLQQLQNQQTIVYTYDDNVLKIYYIFHYTILMTNIFELQCLKQLHKIMEWLFQNTCMSSFIIVSLYTTLKTCLCTLIIKNLYTYIQCTYSDTD